MEKTGGTNQKESSIMILGQRKILGKVTKIKRTTPPLVDGSRGEVVVLLPTKEAEAAKVARRAALGGSDAQHLLLKEGFAQFVYNILRVDRFDPLQTLHSSAYVACISYPGGERALWRMCAHL